MPSATIVTISVMTGLRLVQKHDVAGSDIVDRDLLGAVIAPDERHPGCALDECAQLTPGAPVRHLFERVSAGEHERDHGAGEVLAQHEGAGH